MVAVKRRALFKLSSASMAGTAIGALSGLGADLTPTVVRAQELRIKNAKTYPSVCPYCAVGCGTLVHVVDEKIVNIEGNPASPINMGNLCPKGAASYQLHVNPNRLTKVLRSPLSCPAGTSRRMKSAFAFVTTA
jgi:formate dehydrogenase major subunit